MLIIRKLLTPVITWFTLIIIVIIGAGIYATYNSTQQNEEEFLARQVLVFEEKLEDQENLALSLAIEQASDPAIQEAMANRDRNRLLDLTYPQYIELEKLLGITQFHFHVPPATSFLRLQALNNYGDDLSSFRYTVLSANNEKRQVVGLEVGRSGLGIRGIAPISYNQRHVGTIEFGLDINKAFLDSLQQQFGSEWQVLLLRSAVEVATLDGVLQENAAGPNREWILQASTITTPIYAEDSVYKDVQSGKRVITRLSNNGEAYVILVTPIVDYAGRTIGALEIIQNRTATVASSQLVFTYIGVFALVALFAGIGGVIFLTRRTLQPISDLTISAKKIANGDIYLNIPVKSQDEIGQLAIAFNVMTEKLREMIGGLENMVNDRTNELETASLQMEKRASYLQAVADVARSIASIQDMDYLLPEVVRLISERFGHYHVAIFLVDKEVEYAEIQAASSPGGAHMLARHHRLRVGTEGIVGSVAAFGKAKIALDVGRDATYFNNPDLPDTHSEIALPLIISGRVIGVLDVQSTESGAFTNDDIDVLSTLANQIAVAIENTRLFAQTRQALSEAELANREYVAQEWTRFSAHMEKLGYRYTGNQPEPLSQQFEQPELKATATSGEQRTTPNTISIPIKLRGETIGVIGLNSRSGTREWTQYDLLIAQAAAERASLALENARLLDDTRKRAAIERVTSDISGKISASVRFETIMRTAAEEISRALNGSDVLIQLQPTRPNENPKDES